MLLLGDVFQIPSGLLWGLGQVLIDLSSLHLLQDVMTAMCRPVHLCCVIIKKGS